MQNGKFVELLADATGVSATAVPREDRDRADAAGEWAQHHDWSLTPGGAVYRPGSGILTHGTHGLRFARDINTTGWTRYPVNSFNHALNTAVELLDLPDRFSNHGRDALGDASEVLRRAALRIAQNDEIIKTDFSAGLAAGLLQAADAVRLMGCRRHKIPS